MLVDETGWLDKRGDEGTLNRLLLLNCKGDIGGLA
jgi:hypothetical protein